MGLVTRFERGSRKDAVLRAMEGDEIAVEWEWGGVWGNELTKLKEHTVSSKEKSSERSLKFGVLITYTHTPNVERVYQHVKKEWDGARWPLLLILIVVEESSKYSIGKEFKGMNMSVFDSNGRRNLRDAPALPWDVVCSRWHEQKV